jgi:plastocyanin
LLRFVASLGSAGVLALLVAALLGIVPATAAGTISVQAGAGSKDQSAQSLAFYPQVITANVGDTVTWADGSGEPHTVTFGKWPFHPGADQELASAGGSTFDGSGYTNSGLLPPGANYSLTFSQPGTYDYVCLFHSNPGGGMVGRVVVQAAGAAAPAGQASYRADNDPQVAATVATATKLRGAQWATGASNGNGTATYRMTAGVGDGQAASVMRFGVDWLTVRAGDAVVWSQTDPLEAHTVTFLDNGKDVPLVTPAGGFNPDVVNPAGGNLYFGVGYVNSGLLLGPGAPAPHDFSLTFARPGVYEYICHLHDDIGMVATVEVLPASPRAPIPALQATGHVAAVNGLASHVINYPGDESVTTINLRVSPNQSWLIPNVGFRVYVPTGSLQITGGIQPTLNPDVSANLISRTRGLHTIQVYDYDRSIPIDYQLTIFRGPPENS